MKNIEVIKSHNFFKDIDWENLRKKEINPPYIPEIIGDTDITHFESKYTQRNVLESIESKTDITSSFYKDFTYIRNDDEIILNEELLQEKYS